MGTDSFLKCSTKGKQPLLQECQRSLLTAASQATHSKTNCQKQRLTFCTRFPVKGRIHVQSSKIVSGVVGGGNKMYCISSSTPAAEGQQALRLKEYVGQKRFCGCCGRTFDRTIIMGEICSTYSIKSILFYPFKM